MFAQTFHCTFSSRYVEWVALSTLLGQRLKEKEGCYCLSFLSLTLEGDLKTSWNSQWVASLKASLEALQATAALSSVMSLFLVSSQISNVAAIQIYPSNSSLNCYLYIRCWICTAIENWWEAWKGSHLQCKGNLALINDPVQTVYRVRPGCSMTAHSEDLLLLRIWCLMMSSSNNRIQL